MGFIYILSLNVLLTYVNISLHPSSVAIAKIVTNPVKTLSKLNAPLSGFAYPLVQIYLIP